MNLGVTTVVMNGAGVRMRNARDAPVSDCGEESPDPRPADGGSQTTTPGWTRAPLGTMMIPLRMQ
jgi:hypothetical protein